VAYGVDPAFQIAENFVRTVKVVNDAAEHGVKLLFDFANLITSDPEQRAALLQGVEMHRKLYPDYGKKTLNN
jgi:RNase P/RNase MRP subunit p30